MIPRKQHLPDTTGLIYIWAYRDCYSTCRTCTDSNQSKSQHWEGDVDAKFHASHSLGQAQYPGVVAQHKTDFIMFSYIFFFSCFIYFSLSSVCLFWFWFYFSLLLFLFCEFLKTMFSCVGRESGRMWSKTGEGKEYDRNIPPKILNKN